MQSPESCDDGNTNAGDGCSSSCQLEPYVSCGDGIVAVSEQCDDGNILDGDGCSSSCQWEAMPFCGNALLEPGEECDDGNLLDGDGCSAACTIEIPSFCGDAVVDATEECDDGNTLDGDGCSASCQWEAMPFCGNALLEPGEECDDGNLLDGDGCSAACTIEILSFCGDAIVDAAEECDDGNLVDGDGCSAFCTVEFPAVCGNGFVEAGEDCDDSNTVSADGCSATCRLEPAIVCGDGIIQGIEECDDGNTVSADGCSSYCMLEPYVSCGDGIVAVSEQCDDGNILDGDGCSSSCQWEAMPFCGNALLEPGEECDDGNLLDGDGCSAACTIEIPSFCGDAVVDATEECDDGNSLGGDGCSSSCQWEVTTFCGNALLEPGEECDDGNLLDGDGCSAACTINTPSFCGDAIVDAIEECDDGNLLDGDGCSAFCTVEFPVVCGNGFVEAGEDCDDGNTVSADGCSATCRLEPVVVCGNGVIEGMEECDDGNTVSADGCSSYCMLEPTDVCGNSLLEVSEECDDGNAINGDGCNDVCEIETTPVCGDAVLEDSEECDDGNISNGDGCDSSCVLEFCGDGVLQSTSGELCDDGNTRSGDGCDERCLIEVASCGDGSLQVGEACDDANTSDGDGCSSTCQLEVACGNGVLEGAELCDDGNLLDGDGCSSLCVTERPTHCGDGNISILAGEQCDDGNLLNGDGCDSYCALEFCGDGVLQSALGELCDDGNSDPLDECDASCVPNVCGNGVQQSGESCDDGNMRSGDGCSASCELEVCGNGVVDPNESCDDGNTVSGDGCSSQCLPEYCGDGIVQLELGEQCEPGSRDDLPTCSSDCKLSGCLESAPDTDGNGVTDIRDYWAIQDYLEAPTGTVPAPQDLNGDGTLCLNSQLPDFTCDGDIVLDWLATNETSACHGCALAISLEQDFATAEDGRLCLGEEDYQLAPPQLQPLIRELIDNGTGSPCICQQQTTLCAQRNEESCALEGCGEEESSTAGSGASSPAGQGVAGDAPGDGDDSEDTEEDYCSEEDLKEDLARMAVRVLQDNCGSCHRATFQDTDLDVFDINSISDYVTSGNAESSDLYSRMITSDPQTRMPPPGFAQQFVERADIELVRQWINQGAEAPTPVEPGLADVDFLKAILIDLSSIPAAQRRYYRYFAASDSARSAECRKEHTQAALNKVLNSLHWGKELVMPTPVSFDDIKADLTPADQQRFKDISKTLFRVDLRKLKSFNQFRWPTANPNQIWESWGYIATGAQALSIRESLRGTDDQTVEFAGGLNVSLKQLANGIFNTLGSGQGGSGGVRPEYSPFVKIDWLAFYATQKDLYRQITGTHDKWEIQRALGANMIGGSFHKANDYRHDELVRGIVERSNVTSQNRLLERLCTKWGYYWESYDSLTSEGQQDLVKRPLGPNEYSWGWGKRRSYNPQTWWSSIFEPFTFKHNGGEIIFSLPNGMQAYMLVDANDTVIDAAPTDLVIDVNNTVRTIKAQRPIVNALSCMVCHQNGMITDFVNGVPKRVRASDSYANIQAFREKFDALYNDKKFDELISKDKERFVAALKQLTSSAYSEENYRVEPIIEVVSDYQSLVWPEDYAAEIGATTEELIGYIHKDSLLCDGLRRFAQSPAEPIARDELDRAPAVKSRAVAIALGTEHVNNLITQCS